MSDPTSETKVHSLLDRREKQVEDRLKEFIAQNNKTLVAEFSAAMHERDRGLFQAIAEQEKHMEVLSERVNALRDDNRIYHQHNDKFKEETRDAIRKLQVSDSSQEGRASGVAGMGKAAWAVAALFLMILANLIVAVISKS
jgi:hypothetical protein